MRDAQALYSMDPVRGRLVPRLVELLEATGADRCALVWSPVDGSAGPFPHVVVDAGQDEPRVTFGARLVERGLAAALDGTIGTDRARPSTAVAYMIADKRHRRWCLVLSGAQKLTLGREVAQLFQRARYRAVSVLIDIEDEALCSQSEPETAVLDQAEEAEASGDYEVALDLYEVARSACLAMGFTEKGICATWHQGRTLRKLGRLDEALALYEIAEAAALKMTDLSLAAAIMTGRGTIQRIRGNIRLARRTYEEALSISPPGALAIPLAYFGLMRVEEEVGSLAPAADYGWRAFDAYPPDDPDRMATLAGLADLLLRCGDLGAAEDAYGIVLSAKLRDAEILAVATNGLAQVAAQRHDLEGYEIAIAKLESARGKVQVNVWTQILVDRAQDEMTLGRVDRAREAAEEAMALAEKHKIGRLVIEADELRAMLDNPEPTPPRRVVKGTNRVRGKLRELREALSA